jgi:hypothetical protein
MDDRAKLDQASERTAADAAADRKPWHAPVIDVVSLKNAETNQAQNGDNNAAC